MTSETGPRPGSGDAGGDAGPDNDVDEDFRSLLEGLRTTLPGVQVLFAFLLILPFESSFAELGAPGRTAFVVAFMAAAVSSILLIAPSVHQRIRAPMTGMQRRSSRHLHIAVWLTIAGTAAFLVALGASVYLVADVVLSSTPAVLAVVGVAVLAAWAWLYLPMVTFRKR